MLDLSGNEDSSTGGLGRLLIFDPVAASNASGNLNRYLYAANNPYKFVDPNGRVIQSPNRIDHGNCTFVIASPDCVQFSGKGGSGSGTGNRRPGAGRTSRYAVQSTSEAVHLSEGLHLQGQIQRLDPAWPLPQFVGSSSGPAYNQITNQGLSLALVQVRATVARRIAYNDHSFLKHVIGRGEFAGSFGRASSIESMSNSCCVMLPIGSHCRTGEQATGTNRRGP